MISRPKHVPVGPESTHTSTDQNAASPEEHHGTGLDYMMARYYSPETAFRFLSVDPGVDVALEIPHSWNLYAYVRNSPLSYIDRDGEKINYVSSEQEAFVNEQRGLSPTFDAALSPFDGDENPLTLTFEYGDPGKDDVSGTPRDAVTRPQVFQEEGGPMEELAGTTVTLSEDLSDSKEKDTILHEVSHVDDARKDPAAFDQERKRSIANKTPSEKRPEEIRADAFRKKVKQEVKAKRRENRQAARAAKKNKSGSK